LAAPVATPSPSRDFVPGGVPCIETLMTLGSDEAFKLLVADVKDAAALDVGGITIFIFIGTPPSDVKEVPSGEPVGASKALAVSAGKHRQSFLFPPTILGTIETFD
jgi:hypothetical protein